MASAEDVDLLIRQLEKDTDRQVATAGSSVKGVAAERDLLKSAENARDLLGKAVAGEKDSLDRIFGGTCERIGRLRLALERVTFSRMHAKDARWQNLKDVVETIESVLKDLGTFKPWTNRAVGGPENLEYNSLRRRYSPGRRVHLRPDVEGGPAEAYEVAPQLPSGLELAPATGIISGYLHPTEVVEELTYTVVARNVSGETSFALTFSVAERPPNVEYPAASPETKSVLLGEELRLQPELNGTSPSKWKMGRSPLPSGLNLDEETGEIRGSPTEVVPASAYEVIAWNSGGEVKAIINLEVLMTPPFSLSYPEIPECLLAGKAIKFEPCIRGVPSAWSAEPELPRGVILDQATGCISGAPEALAEESVWKVTARNGAGEVTCEISFSVNVAPPEALSFPKHDTLALLRPVVILPLFEGIVDEFSVKPELPAGLQFDARSGKISGTPSEVAPRQDFEVTARNASGSTATTVVIAVSLAPPVLSGYPSMRSLHVVGDRVDATPEVEGGATHFACDPALPRDLVLDEVTGLISGFLSRSLKETTYTITASNEAGEASVELAVKVAAAAPTMLSYPEAAEPGSASYAVGEAVALGPHLAVESGEGEFEGSFEVEPELPQGLSLDVATGALSGTPLEVCCEATYCITAKNESGQVRAQLTFAIEEAVQSIAIVETIDTDFAASLETVDDIENLPPEPKKHGAFANLGNWMLWMVHRAHLDDPALVDFNFNNLQMPEPHVEERIAPKLVKAMETNTHIKSLSLLNCNLMKPQGVELAASLRYNKTLQVLDVSCNNLDSYAVREIAIALAGNAGNILEQLRVSPQRQVGGFFGRPVEEAMGTLMERNHSIVKLGFECSDANWRNTIDRALLRNNDFDRRRRTEGRLSVDELAELVPAEDRQLFRLTLTTPPTEPLTDAGLANGSAAHVSFWRFVAEKKHVPDATQLRSFASNSGCAIKYAESAPTIKECRSRLLDLAINTDVTAVDIFQADRVGLMRKWSESNNRWYLDIWTTDGSGKRYAYKTDAELVLHVSLSWAEWLGSRISPGSEA
mmetsp:Transcript_59374/g.170594  ORF Transcript_59374/g.170594 Transcript_59374/m.170594 type:complete len:1043 (+) Transcript_59374:66-3194(+)